MNEPIYGCAGCQNTAGAGGCPVHGQRQNPFVEPVSVPMFIHKGKAYASVADYIVELEKQRDDAVLQNDGLRKERDQYKDRMKYYAAEMIESDRLIEEIRKDFALHSCPKDGGFCWLCNASARVELILNRKPIDKRNHAVGLDGAGGPHMSCSCTWDGGKIIRPGSDCAVHKRNHE